MIKKLKTADRSMNEMKLLQAVSRKRRKDGGNIIMGAESKRRMGFNEPKYYNGDFK